MDKQHTSHAFAALGIASLAVAGTCLFFIETLGGLSYAGATLAIFLALLCATKFSALHQPAPTRRYAAEPPAKPRRETAGGARAVPSRDDAEDDVVESRMAALHAAVEAEEPPSTLPPPFEAHSFFAPPESTPGSSVVVIEEPLDAALAQQFAEFRSEPLATQHAASPPNATSLRQMDDIRAQIARLREESRLRHAANARRPRVPPSGFSTPSEDGPSFARTEFLQPVEAHRSESRL